MQNWSGLALCFILSTPLLSIALMFISTGFFLFIAFALAYLFTRSFISCSHITMNTGV
jgi:uncharacterized membrane protein